jgi:hypothetical protein
MAPSQGKSLKCQLFNAKMLVSFFLSFVKILSHEIGKAAEVVFSCDGVVLSKQRGGMDNAK